MAYDSNEDDDSAATELGSWKLNYNNEYRSTEKFVLKQEVSVGKLKFELENHRSNRVYLGRIRVYVLKDY